MKKLRIQIVVQVPDYGPEDRLRFIEKVMEDFREVFPHAEHWPYDDPGYAPPVTVFFPDEDDSAASASMKGNLT